MPDDTEGGFSMGGALQAGASTNAYLGRKKAEDTANNLAAQTKVTYDSGTDLATVQLPSWALTKYMSDALKFQEIEGIYTKQIAEKEARIQQMKSHPFLNTLSQIAASMAANDPNPYTRGLGQAAQRLNPSVSQLEQEKLGATKDLSQVVERERTQDLAYLEHEERLAEARTTHQERAKEFALQMQYREDSLAETRRHHQEWEKDYNLRTEEMKLRKATARTEAETMRVQNTIMRGQSLISSIDDKIQRAKEKFRNYESAVKNPKIPYASDGEKQKALDDLETERARLRLYVEDQTVTKDKLYRQIETLTDPGSGKKKSGQSDPAHLFD